MTQRGMSFFFFFPFVKVNPEEIQKVISKSYNNVKKKKKWLKDGTTNTKKKDSIFNT